MTTEKPPSSIEKIRAEVQKVREEHWTEDLGGGPQCGAWDCRAGRTDWPCPTLRLAEKMLKLAEAIKEMQEQNQYRGHTEEVDEIGEQALAEVAR